MTTYEAGDLVDVPFPFIEATKTKLRPALVLSGPEYQRKTGACILTMITSAERSRWGNDHVMGDWRAAGLKKPSIIRWKVFTLDEALIVGWRGRLAEQDRAAFGRALVELCSGWPLDVV